MFPTSRDKPGCTEQQSKLRPEGQRRGGVQQGTGESPLSVSFAASASQEGPWISL